MATNTPVARVAALQGQVFAQDEKGNLRQLKLDDPIYEGEVLVTGMGASVELAMQDGRTLNVPANETLTFDAEVAALEKPDATDSALLESGKSAEKIIQAVKEGGSLDELLEETAAGNVGGDAGGGPTFVRLMRITEGVDPLNFEFGTNRQGVLDYPLEGGRDTDPAPTLTIDDTHSIISCAVTALISLRFVRCSIERYHEKYH